ncbi:sugar phosphate nucleotidyltransferase [Luteibaculum oceani]|uniref:Nucleotidyltransferase n=1 Tax=Luteibaculum oceani TaxID=1294296 RepID=A0A5C6VLI5_9FLAO|nr:sugar phosphate nucleotidyltransferase [Luteibaculum oceani]TXC85296.1 nucleotidyltransferase [Luteibaculum oceani]
MKIIVPMAGRGSRLRPHTLTVPKPLIPIAGKPIVQRLVEDIAGVCAEKITEIAFIIGDFGKEVEEKLIGVAESLGAKGSIYYQDQPLGTAHAIMCAADSLDGPVIVAFADTLFKADFKLDSDSDGIIWVNKVDNPSAFGVVNLDQDGVIREFVEKPETFVSDLAIIGIYFFKDGAYLKSELQYLLDNDIKDRGEYQITDALENMKKKGTKFKPGKVDHWLDCGNKDVTVATNEQYLEFIKDQKLIDSSVSTKNSVIIEPCYIAPGVSIENSVVGPHVSIGANTKIINSVIRKSIIQENALIENKTLSNSMVGNHAKIHGREEDLSVGDYNVIKH